MEHLTAPPYDVIGESERREYERVHPNNIVRLILPGEAGSAADGSFYAGAAALLEQWRREGTLALDPEPAFYPYRQTYEGPDGARAARLGFLGALELEEPGRSGAALPHEKTLEAPRQDRTRLIAACRANLSPIFLLHPDSRSEVGRCLSRAIATEPLFRFNDARGVHHELWSLAIPEEVELLKGAMAEDWTLIADGHHRYESALAVRNQFPDVPGSRYVLAFFCSLKDRGLRIFPIHRLLRPRASLKPEDIGDLLRTRLAVQPLQRASGPEAALAALLEEGRGSFVAALRGEASLLARFPARDPAPGPARDPVESLDPVLLQREVLSGILGLSGEAIAQGAVGYSADAREAFRQVESGEAAAAFLLNPLSVESVVQAARAGARLPQKSTYFYPKVLTGLVIRAF